ncbi:hypothetical protein QYF61_023707 [Mycteria americana]|uniref:Uncharacterized protein n=1 Tax=Mycteria americana TaxID=33587 RepID=A0AAN7NFA2_MYCAM|nr:hypothetical protein QYF61_023707 [Mycteria americana]
MKRLPQEMLRSRQAHLRLLQSSFSLSKPLSPAYRPGEQDTVGFLGCKSTLPSHVQFFIHQHPQVLLRRAALIQFITQSILI